MRCHGLQCGFCTPGMLMTARALLDRDPTPASRRSARPSPGRSAAAPATRRSCARCSGPPRTPTGPPSPSPTPTPTPEPVGPRPSGAHDHDRSPRGPRAGRQRPDAGRARPDAPQGGPALHPRDGPLRRRHLLPGMLHLAILLARRPCPDRRHRHDRRAGPPQGEGGRHRRRPRRAGAGLDAHPVQRRAGRARHRQGPVPGPGGRVRRGRGPLLGARRARADRRGVRRPAARDRRTHRPRAGRPGDPRRPRGEDRQPLLRLADRRRGGDRGGLRPRRRGRLPDLVYPRVHPAPMETCGCVADYQRVDGQLTLWTTSQAPHAHRTVYALVSGLPSTRSG